jgi:hypothetical protein
LSSSLSILIKRTRWNTVPKKTIVQATARRLLKTITNLMKYGLNLNSTFDPMQWHMLSRANKNKGLVRVKTY